MFSFQRSSAIVLRQFALMQGSPARVVPLFAWVAIDMVTWGFITKYLNSVSGSGFNFVPSLLGAVLFWDFFTRVMQGVTTTFFEDVWSRNFLNIFATPLSISEYIGGLVFWLVRGICGSGFKEPMQLAAGGVEGTLLLV
jgi:ABC-2 type transport system permease protein